MDEVFELPVGEKKNHMDDSNNDLEIDLVTDHIGHLEKVEDVVQENNIDDHSKQNASVILNSKKAKARLKVESDHNAKVWQVILKEVKRPGKSKYSSKSLQIVNKLFIYTYVTRSESYNFCEKFA